MTNFLNKFKSYIQIRIESVEYHMQGIKTDSSMGGYYRGFLGAFTEMLEYINFLIGEETK